MGVDDINGPEFPGMNSTEAEGRPFLNGQEAPH
jgi:hypothetical protein